VGAVLTLFRSLVGRHLDDLAAQAQALGGSSLDREIRLDRVGGAGDELDRLVGALDTMRENLRREIATRQGAQAELTRLNVELERRVAERTAELSHANAALLVASQSKDAFFAGMSHELRTPLNAILGFSEALQEGIYGPVERRQRRALSTIEEAGRHLLSLINDILDLSKIGAGRLELEIEAVSIEGCCQASVRLVEEAARARRQGLEVRIAEDAVTVPADERRLTQVLVNLLGNAVKFTPEGGQVGLDVGLVDAGAAVCFTVWDRGVGIAARDLPRLFERFVQLDAGLGRLHGGTGLGLALARDLVELHGGTVAVESAPGEGSRFSVTLPLALGAPAVGAWAGSAPPGPLPSGS
jgi:signal transduction histidine kinase